MAKYDVFASYHRSDAVAVEKVSRGLRDSGLKVFLDQWSMVPGRPWLEAVVDAIDACQTFAAFLGPHGFGRWHTRETQLALDRQARDSSFGVIPVLLPGAMKPDGFVGMNTWVEFPSIDDPGALEYLIDGIAGRAPEARTTLERVRQVEEISLVPLAMFCGAEFVYLSYLAPLKEDAELAGQFYGVRMRLIDNLRRLSITRDTADMLRRQLDSDNPLEAQHSTRLAIRDDLSYEHGVIIAEAFEGGLAFNSLYQLLQLYEARGEGLDEDTKRLVSKYVDSVADHVSRSSDALFPGLLTTDVPTWLVILAGSVDADGITDLIRRVATQLGRLLGQFGIGLPPKP